MKMSHDVSMIRRNLKNNVLALCCAGECIFIGMGCTLYTVIKSGYKIINRFDPFDPYADKVGGIIKESDNKLIVFGEKCICFFKYTLTNENTVTSTDFHIKFDYSSKIFRFTDWIITAKFFGTIENAQLAILFAHNNLYTLKVSEKQHKNVWCQEKCLLYGGSIFIESQNNILVFSGTVFQEILIWKNQGENAPILHRLKGHNGVIFSVFYNAESNLIYSTSDDRSVRLWKVINHCNLASKKIDWENSEIHLQTTMFGHTARVWKAMIKNNLVVSIGEDSQICIWSINGKLLNKIQAHHGAAIWSLDISEEFNFIVTGGEDGSVYMWPFNSVESLKTEFSLSLDYKIPKYVCFLKSRNIIVLKEKGNVCYINNNNNKLIETHYLPARYHNYCLTTVSPNKTNIALASIDGYITLYKEHYDGNVYKLYYEKEEKIMQTKIFSMQWLDNKLLLVCGTEGYLNVVECTKNGFTVLSEFILPASRERWITAATTHANLVICGDRAGSIFLYNLTWKAKDTLCGNEKNSLKDQSPSQIFYKIHGSLGVQSCVVFDEKLITMGRDGALRFYLFRETNGEISVEILYKKNLPMCWICRMIKVENDQYILGFNEADFLVYSFWLDRIMIRIPCGGGHRSWDCVLYENSLKFIYIRDKRVNFVNISMHFLALPTIMEGFHTKEIYCLDIIPLWNNSEKCIFISGSEDCTLRVSCVDLNEFKVFQTYDGHISSIRCLSVVNIKNTESENINLVFSGGGRAQLKVWEISIKMKKYTVEGVNCKDIASFMLRGTDKERKKFLSSTQNSYDVNPETRFMDTSVMLFKKWNRAFIFLACSDGYLRILIYDVKSNIINLGIALHYTDRCILKTHSFLYKNCIIVLTMATDGFVSFWNINVNDEGNLDVKDTEKPFYKLKLHQCGINSYDFKTCEGNSYLLATGGDDNLLSFILFEIHNSLNGYYDIKIISQWSNSSTYFAQITGVRLLDEHKVMSVGADQRVSIHSYSSDKKELYLVKQIITSISDVQGMALFPNNGCDRDISCVYGCGIELIIDKNEHKSFS